MKIALVVHGRFHAFDLARALVSRGHDVTLFTNYPSWAVERFCLPMPSVRTFPLHGALSRACSRIGLGAAIEPQLHKLFGAWVARELRHESWDVIHSWSGVSEELLSLPRTASTLTLLMRGSAHVSLQSRLLVDEERRSGVPLDRPSPWMIEREQREYALADKIAVLSTFARRSFEAEGMPADKLAVLPLGVDVQAFRPAADAIARRRQRVLAGEPLNVLYVGALSYRKGLFDLLRVIDSLSKGRFRFTLAGSITSEAANAIGDLKRQATVLGALPQGELPNLYANADLFLFPTVEDGFGMVLTQAKAAGLPIVTTANCAGPDLIRPGRDGWIVPIRDSEAIVERLRWCDEHREDVARMTSEVYEQFRPRDWSCVADDFEVICQRPVAGVREMELVAHA